MAGALAMNEWADECDVLGAETSNEGQFHYRQGVLVAIGLVFTQTWERLGMNTATKRRCIGSYAKDTRKCGSTRLARSR